jgi:hypothetical protein
MAKSRSTSRIRTLFRSVVVGGLVLWCLSNLHEIRHRWKQRAFARSLSKNLHVSGSARDFSLGNAHVSMSEKSPDDISHKLPRPATPAGSSRGASTLSDSRSRLEDQGGSRVSVKTRFPERWSAHEPSSGAHNNAARDANCLEGGAHADDGGRHINLLPSLCTSSAAKEDNLLGLCAVLVNLLPDGGDERAVLLAFDHTNGNDALDVGEKATQKAGARAVLVVAADDAAASRADVAGLPSIIPDCGGPCPRPQFAAAAAILAMGFDVLLVGHGSDLHGPNPLRNIPTRRGADVEGVTPAGAGLGSVVGMSDPPMGWSAYSQSMAVPQITSSLVLMRATDESRRLAEWLGVEDGDDTLNDDAALSDELLLPAHDGRQRSGATFRTLPRKCFGPHRGGASVVDAAKGFPSQPWRTSGSSKLGRIFGGSGGEDPNEILASESFDAARAVVLRDGPIGGGDANGNCAAISPKDRHGPLPRALRYVTPQEGDFPVACEELPDLCKVVSSVAISRQVLAAVSNSNILYMLGLFLDGVNAANITNTIVVALDQRTADWCSDRGAPYYHRELKSLTGSTDNHATSGLKFQVLREFLTVGVSVLLSDVDVVWMRNPFGGSRLIVPATQSNPKNIHVDQAAIYGDSDVEGMTDGWDDVSAYGFGFEARANSPMRRLVARNSGLFYLAATFESLRMVTRLAERMRTERNTWDQTAYNEEQVYLWSSDKGAAGGGGPPPAGVSQRVMNYVCFQNTKYLFRYMRYDPQLYDGEAGLSLRPISVHVNYHPEKPQRMVSLIAQYLKGERDVIAKWHWGEGSSFNKPCTTRPKEGEGKELMQKSRLAKIVSRRAKEMAERGIEGMWANVKGFKLMPDGSLKSPWGSGAWGVVPTAESEGKDRLFLDFTGAKHMVTEATFEGELLHLTSLRCNDGDKVIVTL